jgi:hypothetical protein
MLFIAVLGEHDIKLQQTQSPVFTVGHGRFLLMAIKYRKLS